MVLNHTRVLTSIVAALSTVIDGESSWTDHCTVQGSSCTALIAAATPGESEQALFHGGRGRRCCDQLVLKLAMVVALSLCSALAARDHRTGPRGCRFPRATVHAPAGPHFLSTPCGARRPTVGGRQPRRKRGWPGDANSYSCRTETLRLHSLLGIERMNAYSGCRACGSRHPISSPRARSRRAPERLCSSCRRCARRAKAHCTRGTYRWTPWTGSGPRRSAFGAVLPPGNLNFAYIGGFSVLHAAFRADRSPTLCSAGRLTS
jgi:hypothetical protein